MQLFIYNHRELESLHYCLDWLGRKTLFLYREDAKSSLIAKMEAIDREVQIVLGSRMEAIGREVQSSLIARMEAIGREVQSLLISRMEAIDGHVLNSLFSRMETFYREVQSLPISRMGVIGRAVQSLLISRMEAFYREIKKWRRIISNFITMINRLLFNWLLSYIILAFHRDRYSPRYTSTTDEDSSASYRFQLSNYGATKGMLGLSFHL